MSRLQKPSMVAAKAKVRSGRPSSYHLPDLQEGEWAVEPETYAYETMTSGNAEMITAMQQRMLNMENALTRVIRHLETASGVHQTMPDALPSDSPESERGLGRHHKHSHARWTRSFAQAHQTIQNWIAWSLQDDQAHGKAHQFVGSVLQFQITPDPSDAMSRTSSPAVWIHFAMMIRHQPHNVWVSPDCGPWSSWSRLNESRSLDNREAYAEKRYQLLYQIALCIVLFRHQIQNNREFLWEQPARSLMHPSRFGRRSLLYQSMSGWYV